MHLKHLIENQFNARIKVVQTDGGIEYKPLSKVFGDNGIIHRISCSYTPQQNGLAERKHRHIVETRLSPLAHSKVPLKIWDDAFSAAVYIIYKPNPHQNIDIQNTLGNINQEETRSAFP